MITKNKFYIKAFFALCGFLIIFWTLYMRFLRPRAIGEVDFTYSNTKLCMYIFLIFIFSLPIIILLLLRFYSSKLSEKIKNKTIGNDSYFYKRLSEFLPKIREFYEKSLETFYHPFYLKINEKFPDFWYFFYIFGRDTFRIHLERYFIIFSYLPPCIISVTYFIEVVILNKFTYFPLAVFLMIFPIGMRIFLYNIQLYGNLAEECFAKAIKLVKTFPDGGELWTWADNSWVAQEIRYQALLEELARAKKENISILKMFEYFRTRLNTYYVRFYFSAISSTFWIISFSYMVYRILN
jgi:hypothetical protein